MAAFLLILICSTYITAFMVLLLFGIVDEFNNNKCESSWRRIEYVLPAYRLGCWLGKKE